jgi:Ca-activated chloride channel family protein
MADMASAAAAQGVSTSTYGLGSSFNEDLMIAIGKRGDGNHYYGQTAADLFEPFAEEFDLIGSLHARNVQLTLAVPAGVGLRFLSEHRVESRGGFQAVHLRDLGFGSEAWALIELEVPARLAGDDLAQVLHAAGSASTPEGLPIAVADATLALPGVSAAAWDVLLADERVAARKAEIEAAQLLAQAREAAGRGDWVGIDALIAQAQQQYAGQPWLSEILAHMQRLAQARDSERFSKEALYSSGRLSSRLSSTHELTGSLEDELQSPSFLRRKRAQGQAQFRPTDPDTPDETPQ